MRRSTVTGNRAHALPRTVPSDLVRAALITGGSSGIGRAIAEDLAAAGLGISIASRDPERAGLAGAHPIAVDLSDPTTASDVVASHVRRHGRLDVLVNAAGVAHSERVGETSIAAFDAQVALNLRATVAVCRRRCPSCARTAG